MIISSRPWNVLIEVVMVLDLVLHVDLLVVVSTDAEAIESGIGGTPRGSRLANLEVRLDVILVR